MQNSTVVSVSGPQQATYAQVCAASVTSVQHKSEPQPSILASRLAQARVSMSGGAVTEIKKREMDVVSPSDCGSTSASSTGPSLPPHPPVLNQRLVDQFTVMLPGSSGDQVSSGMAEHSSGSAEFTNLNQDIVPKVRGARSRLPFRFWARVLAGRELKQRYTKRFCVLLLGIPLEYCIEFVFFFCGHGGCFD